jgi:hypothetical protein
MRMIALMIAFVAGLIVPGFAQQAEIEAVNTKWIDFFNKGDFAGIASLYTERRHCFAPGLAYREGQSCNRGDVEKDGRGSKRSETHYNRRQAFGVLCGARDWDLQSQSEGCHSARSHRQICSGVGKGR